MTRYACRDGNPKTSTITVRFGDSAYDVDLCDACGRDEFWVSGKVPEASRLRIMRDAMVEAAAG